MTALKRKISVSLDADLIEELERDDETLSKQLNDALREVVERRRRLARLEAFLAELDARHGAVSKRLIAKYEELLA
ncbi:MAG: type II toxin-antitoxin system CcdA family antitoxin [Myxococcales bacterium]|nr:type II toxin-antitoxin system CcdA family antitoxin [Myxococcales bacterium]